ncbi:MAG: TonB family protein, partial [candidate division Zixibacteria bacterium]|nr:TonB family protein [candidate division Zixibacteria bacterium]
YENAIKKASKVLTFHPKSKWADDALFLIGRAYFNMEEYVKAKRKFEELVASFPKSKLVNDSRYYISMCCYYSGEEIEAISLLRNLIESEKVKKKRKGEVSFMIGEIYFQRKEYADAITYYEKTLNQFDPDTLSAITQFHIGECFWLKKDYTNAKESFAGVEERHPTPDLLFDSKFREGECWYVLGDHQKGMEIYVELSEDERFSAKLPSIKLKIAQGYYFLDELSLSMEEFYQVIEDYPKTEESAKAYFQLAQIYQDKFGDLGQAKEMYESCKGQNPRSETAKEALAKSANISKIEKYQKELSDEETDKSSKALFLLGELYLTQMNQPDSALAEYLALVDQFPQSEYAVKSLYAAAWILENVKDDSAEAAGMYKRILNEYPQSDYRKLALEFLDAWLYSFDALNVEKVYQEAERLLFEENQVDSALALYGLIMEEFPQSLYASKSAYARAWAIEYFANPGDSTVVLAYQSVIDEYPGSEYAEGARIKLGLSQRARPTLPPPSVDTTLQEEEEKDTTMIAEPDTSGPQIPKAPIPLKRGEFVYPESEILSGIKGAVVLKIRIDLDGTVSDAEVVNSLENMWIDEAAREAVLNTTFDLEKIDPMQLGEWFIYTVEVKPPKLDEDSHIDPTIEPDKW